MASQVTSSTEVVRRLNAAKVEMAAGRFGVPPGEVHSGMTVATNVSQVRIWFVASHAVVCFCAYGGEIRAQCRVYLLVEASQMRKPTYLAFTTL
jgi:hypothetical protein